MKKFLFSCLLALGIGVNAQYDFTQDFEGDLTGFYQFGGGALNTANYCSATTSGSLTYSATVSQTGWMADLLEVGDITGQTNNGQALTVSFNYKKAAGLTGTLYAMYAIFSPQANSWTIYTVGTGVPLTSAAVTECANLSATIPAGTFDPAKIYGVGTWLVRTGGTTGALYIDDLSVKQAVVTSVPPCTSFTTPADGSTIAGGTVGLSWQYVSTASAYKLTVGTTPGGSDVLNTTVIGTMQNVSLATNTTYYAKVVPTNNVGDATGCQEISFTTNSTVGHCGPITSTVPTNVAPINSVTFASITKSTGYTAAGSVTPYIDYTADTTFEVKNNVSSLPLVVKGVTIGTTNRWGMAAFIDWNNDGDFEDAGESYFNTPATMITAVGSTNPVTLTGNITVPVGTALGKKVMRVKYNFNSSTTIINPALSSACSSMTNGQTLDFTLDYQEFLAVTDVSKVGISIYPNPFTDVLKISDVKDVKSISVNDMTGREVKTLAPASEINLSNLKSGLYLVNLKMADGSVKTFKAIKK